MGSIQHTVHYFCVAKGNGLCYEYSKGDHGIVNMAAMCLERTPPFHKWYFETLAGRTFGFLMDEGLVYFAVADEGLGDGGLLAFLEHTRDEFKKAAGNKRGSRAGFSGLNHVSVEEQLVPVIRRLIASLERVSQSGGHFESYANAQTEGVGSSTRAPLLGKASKQEKKKQKDNASTAIDIELEEHRKCRDRGVTMDATAINPNSQSGSHLSVTVQKDSSPESIRSALGNKREKWRRQVKIILAVDAAICLTLLGIWLSVCKGIKCTH